MPAVRSLTVSPEANADILEAVVWYESRRPGLSLKFEEDLDRRIEAIRQAPDGYALIDRGYRQALLKRFPYSVVFRATAARVVVVAVPHHKRDQRAWLGRLKPR